MQKLKLSRWTTLAVLSLFTAVTFFTSIPAFAAFTDQTGANGATVADEAFSYQAYIYIAGNDAYRCAPHFANDIDPGDAGAGRWFTGGYATRSGTLLGPDGQADCNNGNGWLDKAMQLWGWGGNYGTFLCSIGYTQKVGSAGASPGCRSSGSGDGGFHNDGVTATKIQQSIKNKAYNGTMPTLDNAMRYYIYFYNFKVGCSASPVKAWADADNNERLGDNVYKIDQVDEKGVVTPWLYKGDKGHGANVTIGYAVDPPAYELSCGDLEKKLQNSAYSNAYADAVKANPQNGIILANVASGSGGTAASDADACGLPADALRWIACPVTSALGAFADFMSDQIRDLLTVPTEQIFTPQFKSVWMVFRNVGMVLVIIAALVMIISQAAGMEIVDAYTIRKLLPRIALVLIGIALAWPLLQFIVTFFNDIGIWARNLIEAPFNSMAKDNLQHFNTTGAFVNWMILGVGGVAGVIGLAALGVAGTLALLGSIVLALLIGLFVLAVRQLVIAMAVLFAPLALAAYILPGTQKLWNFWRQTFMTALMMFPIIMAFIAGGKALAIVANASGQHLLALLVYFAPYFMLPFAFKLAGGLMATIFSISNDRSRGLFDRSKKFRQGKIAQNTAAMKAGNRFNNRALNTISSRAATQRLGIGKRGRAAYEQKMALSAYDFAKSPEGQSIQFNDPALQAMTYGSAAEARANMARDWGVSNDYVESSIAAVKANGGFGKTRQVWAAKQLAATGTGYEDEAQMYSTINRAAGGNLDLAQSMWGEMRGTSERAGRVDLKSGYGSGAKVLEKIAGSGLSRTDDIRNRFTDDFTDLGIEAARGVDNMQVMRQKPRTIQNFMRHLERGQQKYQQILQNPASTPVEREEAATKLGQIRAKMENMQDYVSYGPEVNSEYLSGKREVVVSERDAQGRPVQATTNHDAGTVRSLPNIVRAQEQAAGQSTPDYMPPAAQTAYEQERQRRITPEEARRMGLDQRNQGQNDQE